MRRAPIPTRLRARPRRLTMWPPAWRRAITAGGRYTATRGRCPARDHARRGICLRPRPVPPEESRPWPCPRRRGRPWPPSPWPVCRHGRRAGGKSRSPPASLSRARAAPIRSVRPASKASAAGTPTICSRSMMVGARSRSPMRVLWMKTSWTSPRLPADLTLHHPQRRNRVRDGRHQHAGRVRRYRGHPGRAGPQYVRVRGRRLLRRLDRRRRGRRQDGHAQLLSLPLGRHRRPVEDGLRRDGIRQGRAHDQYQHRASDRNDGDQRH